MKNLGSFVVLVSACLVFFYPFFLKGLIPIPADIIVGVSYPYLDYKWEGFPFGVPVKNPITSDVVSFSYPMRTLGVEQLKSGVLPLWNNLILTGTPLLGNFQSAPFSPTNIVYLFLSVYDGWSWQIILQPILASIFLYFFLKELGLGKLSSILGGLVYAFSGFMTIWLEWNSHSLVAAFFPLVFFWTLRWLRSENILFLVALSFTLALQIFAGYPQIILYEFLGLFLLIWIFDFTLFKSLGKLLQLVLFILLGVGLAAVQILPALELLGLSQRSVEVIPDEWTFFNLKLLITLFAPDYFGNHATYNYWGPANYTLNVGYSGLIAFILATIAVIKKISQKYVKFGLSLIILSLLIATQNPFSILLKQSGFLGLQAGTFHRSLVLCNLGIGILSAVGFELLHLRQVKKVELLGAFYIPTIFLVAYGLVSFMGKLEVGLKNLVVPGIYLLATVLLILGSCFKKYQKIMLVLLFVLTVSELFRFGWKYTPFSPKSIIFPETPIISYLKKQEKPFRVHASGVIPTNFMMVYGIETVEGYDAVYPNLFAKYLGVLNSGNAESLAQDRYGAVSRIDSPLFNLTDAKYILVVKQNGRLPEQYDKPNLKLVFEDKSVVVLENTEAMKRAQMFYNFEVSSGTEVLTKLLAEYPIQKSVILEKSPNIETTFGSGEVELKDFDKGIIKVKTDKPGVLFVSQSYYPGWVATVDGVETEIIKADFSFMGIPIRGVGEHIVKIEYKPGSFKKGKYISLASLLGLLICLFYYRRRIKDL